MKADLRSDYEARLTLVVDYLIRHLDEPFNLSDLADQACYSRYHFHRLFQAFLGETPGELTRRLQLERAASRLVRNEGSVLEIALEAGYGSGEAFARAFARAFGHPPSDFKELCIQPVLPSNNGIHIDESWRTSRIAFITSEKTMKVTIKKMSPIRVVSLPHKGPYHTIGQAFGALYGWAGPRGLATQPSLGIYHDDPHQVPESDLRSEACLILPEGRSVESTELTEMGLEVKEIPAGDFAMAEYMGSYAGLGGAWDQFISRSLPETGREPTGICYELYVKHDMADPNACVTELYQQIK